MSSVVSCCWFMEVKVVRWHCRPSTLQTDSLLSSKEDVQAGDMRQWSSTDSSGYSTDGSSRLRVNVTKASSFHGVTVLSRADSSATSTGGYYMSKTGATCNNNNLLIIIIKKFFFKIIIIIIIIRQFIRRRLFLFSLHSHWYQYQHVWTVFFNVPL